MTDFTIVDGKPWHCGQMIRILRHEHTKSLITTGVDSHRELKTRFDLSIFCRAWLVDGQLAALGGVCGSKLSALGFVWFAMSERAKRYPVALVKEARRQLEEIMVVKRELATTIIPDDDAALRLAVYLGFHVADSGRGAPAESRSGRRHLADFVKSEPSLRVPVGIGYVIPMGYHHDGAA